MDRAGRLLAFVFAVLAAGAVAAQSAMLADVVEQLRRNQQTLEHYRWKTRTEITLDGEAATVSLAEVRRESDGKLRRTPIGGPEPSRSRRTAARLEDLARLVGAYAELDSERMRAALAVAHAWEGVGDNAGVLRVQARGVLRQGDSMDLWVDSASKRPRRIEILTSLAGEPVRLAVELADVAGGPTYPARTTLETEIKEKKMVIRTESFDYVREEG